MPSVLLSRAIILCQGSLITDANPGRNGPRESIYTDESLPSSLPDSIIDDTERVALALVSTDGLVRQDGHRHRQVEVPVGLVVTDRHLLFAAVGGDGSNAGKLAYDDLAGVDVEDGTLVITTTDGVTWRFPLAESDSEAVDIALRHLRWIGEVRNRLVSTENDVDLASGKIRTLTADLAWEEALATYRDARKQLDELVCLVQCTTPLRDWVLAPELPDLDRQLESACARLYVERCRSQLDLTTQHVQYGNYEQAREVFAEAEEYHDRARSHTEEVKRPDAFQFGRQRDLTEDLEELQWVRESTAAEPLQAAKEAAVRADNAQTLTDEIEHLETALDRYRGIRTLGWDEYLATDADTTGSELESTATRLVECHEQAARDRWNEGSRHEATGDMAAAIQECTVATEHLERAHELAEEFSPNRAGKFESRLKQMFEVLLDMQGRQAGRESEEADTENEPDPVQSAGSSLDDVPDPSRRGSDLPTLEDLVDVDLHHDITLDLEGDADPLDLEDDTFSFEDDPLGVAESDESEESDEESDAGTQCRSNGSESI